MEFFLESELENKPQKTTTTTTTASTPTASTPTTTTTTTIRTATTAASLHQRAIEQSAEQQRIMLQVLQHKLLLRQQEQMSELLKNQLGSPISTRVTFSPSLNPIGLAAMITIIAAILM